MFFVRNSILYSLVWICAVLWGGAAQAALSLSQVAEDLRQRLQADPASARLLAAGAALHSQVRVSLFYAERGYQPAWLSAAGALPAADALLAVLGRATEEGLQPADYHWEEIRATLAAPRRDYPPPVRQAADLDLLLTDAFLTYGAHLMAGRLDPRSVDRSWTIKPRSEDLVLLLHEALAGNRVAETLRQLSPPYPEYAGLRTALARYREIAGVGGWPAVSPGPKLEQGMRDPRVKQLRVRLRASGDLDGRGVGRAIRTAGQAADPDSLFDEALAQAVRRFQRRHGIEVDGIVGPGTLAALNVPAWQRVRQIEINLERWRWLPEALGRRYILVNIPGYDLAVVEEGRRVLEARVVVGKSIQPTPVFAATLRYLVLDPYWHVPRSIALKEMLPQLRRDPYALFWQDIRIFDLSAGGQEVDPGTVDWHAVNSGNFHYRFRQDPGRRNSLGRIKFMFPNPYSVYLHDTPARHLFERAQRSFSHGCIRVSEPMALAEYLLRDDPRWNRDALLAATGKGRERSVRLPESVQIYLLYWTAWVDADGTVHFRDDIYGRDPPLNQALASL